MNLVLSAFLVNTDLLYITFQLQQRPRSCEVPNIKYVARVMIMIVFLKKF